MDDHAQVVEAERFVLKDKNGRMRGEWTTLAGGDKFTDGQTGLRLLDRDGNARIQLWVSGGEGKSADTPSITLHHSDKISRLALMVPHYGKGIINIAGKDKKTLVDLPADLLERKEKQEDGK